MALSLERILTHPDLWALTRATPVQRAVCRVLDGLPLDELWRDPDVKRAFGGTKPPEQMPLEFLLLSAIRAGKGVIASACAFRASQTVDLSSLRPGETARISVLSLDKDKAQIVFSHLLGAMQASDVLRPLLVGEPSGDTITIRQEGTGRLVEVMVTAGKRAGGSLVGRWMAGVIFDEAARMVGVDEGVVNLDDSRRAVLGRMLPGAQILYISSPWAPFGPVYEWTEECFGKPTRELVVVRATGPMMNPSLWTPEKCEALRKQDPIAHKTDVLSEFADAEYSAFHADELDAVMRADAAPVPPQKRHHYVATMDPATRSNAWTLTIWTCTGLNDRMQPVLAVPLARQWHPRYDKLKPIQVLTEICDVVTPYGIDTVHTDQFAVDALADLCEALPDREPGEPRELMLVDEAANATTNYEGIKTLQTLVQERRVSLPRDYLLRQDLIGTKQRVTQEGVRFQLPKTRDGRHGDYVPALARGARMLIPPPDPPEPEIDRDLEAARARVLERSSADWWEGVIGRVTGVPH